MINKIMKNLQIARKSLIYTDSTGADKVAPAEKNSTDVSAASAAFSISDLTLFVWLMLHLCLPSSPSEQETWILRDFQEKLKYFWYYQSLNVNNYKYKV